MQNTELQNVKQRFGIIGTSNSLNRAIEVAVQVAPTDLSVLITGESGVGKESFPQIIHHYSHRKHGPYIAVNCGAIPEGTIDSELFGHEKGAFTGATSDRKGYFEVADGGTIFLDEVGELPLSTQVRLLRVLEVGEFIKVGSSKALKTDVRVVAATNLNIQKAITEGKFREDLYYRLNTVPITVAALRKRKEDITLLFRKFSADFAEKYRMPAIKLTDDAKALLTNYYWSGNVRQLKNITEQISVIEKNREVNATILKTYLPDSQNSALPALFSSNESGKTFQNEREILYQVLFDMKKDMTELKKVVATILQKDNRHTDTPSESTAIKRAIIDLQEEQQSANHIDIVHAHANSTHSPHIEDIDGAEFTEVADVQESNTAMTMVDMEKEMIKKALLKSKGRRKTAAKELGISERTLYRKIKEYELEKE